VSENKEIPIMSEKMKKIDRQYVLSDSSVNEYGFRLLTSGYQLASFRKNPIGYYMHRREEGMVLKWEDLEITDDKVVGTPVINLSNARGAQLCEETENGFLNAASVGHIVVLEYSMEKELMLPGQTGPTITKWYNKECSLVDIPGNSNALTQLYDENENALNLADLHMGKLMTIGLPGGNYGPICAALQLPDSATAENIVTLINDLKAQTNAQATEILALSADNDQLHTQLTEIKNLRRQSEINGMLDRALEDRKLTKELRDKLAVDYAQNVDGLSALLGAMPAYRTIAEHLSATRQESTELQWLWDDYEKNDPTGNKLKSLRATDPIRYKELFDKKFAA
jgi:hypothetical protein